jgi:3-methylfumaryl-CoA hydratase
VSEALGLAALRAWIGREHSDTDLVTPELVKRFRATFDLAPGGGIGDIAPLAMHWCLAPSAAPTGELGSDGHPAKGGFLPPVPLPRRMWAGGELEFGRPIRCGDEVRRVSRIENVEAKAGRTGPLCFVTVSHTLHVGDDVAVRERQDIVYRGAEGAPPPSGEARAARPDAPLPTARSGEPAPRLARTIVPTSALLFLYSALTFNGHRIHYDRRYCLEEEGYPGLVVHGPLQATLLLHFAAELRGGEPPKRFVFRSEAPLFDLGPVHLAAEETEKGIAVSTSDAAGKKAMRAEAIWS